MNITSHHITPSKNIPQFPEEIPNLEMDTHLSPGHAFEVSLPQSLYVYLKREEKRGKLEEVVDK